MVADIIKTDRIILLKAQEFFRTNFVYKTVVLAFTALYIYNSELRDTFHSALVDAFLQVTVFVAATLFLASKVEQIFRIDLNKLMARNEYLQIIIASFLGVLPGCGGAIVVVTQYTRGHASFGSFIAVLVATMGDAAIILISKDVISALFILSISFFAGIISGGIVNTFYKNRYQKTKKTTAKSHISQSTRTGWINALLKFIWGQTIILGTVFGFMLALQIEIEAYIPKFLFISDYSPVKLLGLLGSCLCILMWIFKIDSVTSQDNHENKSDCGPIAGRVIQDTNFVTAWVILAFLGHGIFVKLTSIDVDQLFTSIDVFLPLFGILVGLIPGCGPQIVITSLYVTGAIPLSVLLANSIANDGDALFPALALTPKAAFIATIYSTIPAAILGYAYFFFFE